MAIPSTQNDPATAPGVRGGTQARQPSGRQLPEGTAGGRAEAQTGVSLAEVRSWIRKNQTLAVTAAFVTGLFMGISMRR